MTLAIVEVTVPPPRGCPGQPQRISGFTAALCYGCARYGVQGPQIEPRAAIDRASQTWQCPDRLNEFPEGAR